MAEFFEGVSPLQGGAAALVVLFVWLIFTDRVVTKGHTDALLAAEKRRADAAEERERKVEDAWRESQRAHGEKDEQLGMAIESITKIVQAVENARRETGVGEP